MKNDGSMIAVWVALFASLSVVALVLGFGIEKANFESTVRKCVAKIEASDVRNDVEHDAKNGEFRFYYDLISEWDLAGGAASGIFDDHSKTCGRPRDIFREQPFREYARYRKTGRNGKVWASDPIYSPTTDCGRVLMTYMRDYNRMMAELHPASIEKYCR